MIERITHSHPAAARAHGHQADRRQIEEQFLRLARRYAELDRSPYARDQRELSSLRKPLMELFAALHPEAVLRERDDFDVVMRARRRQS